MIRKLAKDLIRLHRCIKSNFMEKKTDNKIYVCRISKRVRLSYMKWRRANSVDPDEVAHHEPPHLDLHCFQMQLHVFSFLMLLVLMMFIYVSCSYVDNISVSYAWDEPTLDPFMTLSVANGTTSTYNLNILGETEQLTYQNFIYISATATFPRHCIHFSLT